MISQPRRLIDRLPKFDVLFGRAMKKLAERKRKDLHLEGKRPGSTDGPKTKSGALFANVLSARGSNSFTSRAGLKRQVDSKARAARIVPCCLQPPVELPKQSDNHLEPKACAWLIDVEAFRKTDTLVGNFDVKVQNTVGGIKDTLRGK
jgi:hypothetical protein